MRTLPLLLTFAFAGNIAAADEMEWVKVARDKKSFVLESSGKPFVPWGFNYDHDEKGRLIEDYWDDEWEKVDRAFVQMRKFGANVVRIHLQFGKFMTSADKPNEAALKRFDALLKLAERERLYLDVTGLACYHKKDVPAWYDELSEEKRWEAQAAFWHAVAERGAKSPAVFCYDLMNEPVVGVGKAKKRDWLGPAFGDKHFVQYVSLDQGERKRPEIARAWIKRLAAEVRKADRRHLVTVGLVDWSLDRPGLSSGFVPKEIVADLDFLCVHLYPEKGKGAEALKTLEGFAVGVPVVIEETFPLKCSMEEFKTFVEDSRTSATGWIGFYWGQTPEDLKKSKTLSDAVVLRWLEFFEAQGKKMKP